VPLTVEGCSTARNIFSRSNTGTVGSNPLETWVSIRVYSVSVSSCVGSGLATGLIPCPRSLTDCVWRSLVPDQFLREQSTRHNTKRRRISDDDDDDDDIGVIFHLIRIYVRLLTNMSLLRLLGLSRNITWSIRIDCSNVRQILCAYSCSRLLLSSVYSACSKCLYNKQ
jgi:hypothetical protein